MWFWLTCIRTSCYCFNLYFFKINDFEALKKEKLFPGPFKLPPRNKLYVFVFMEICSGKHFEYSDIFVQYQIMLPQGWVSSDLDHVKGRTHICKAANDNGLVYFGHNIEILLEYNLTNLGQTNGNFGLRKYHNVFKLV